MCAVDFSTRVGGIVSQSVGAQDRYIQTYIYFYIYFYIYIYIYT